MRSLLIGCVALCALLAGCEKADDGAESKVGASSLFDPVAANPSLCGGAAIPFPNNALFADATSATGITTDTTLALPSSPSTAAAASLTDGFSTSASIFTDVLGEVDLATASTAIKIIEADATPRILVPGVDYTIQPSIAMAQVSGTGGACASNPLPAKFQPISQQRTRLLIEPLKPLNASTTYIVAVTKDLKSVDGLPATPSEFFPIVNSDTAVSSQTALVLAGLTPTQRATLESLRSQLVRPTVNGFKSLYAALGPDPDLTDGDFVIVWSFTTQSISKTLGKVYTNATAKTFTVGAVPNAGAGDLDANGRLGTGELGVAGIPNSADIYVGTLNAVPYYLDDASSTTDAASQGGFWLSDGVRDAGVVAALNNTPCSAPGPFSGFLFAPSVSTTNCFPTPAERSQENLPVIITVPKTAVPGGGFPVVIFQHGITGNRAQMIPLGATLAQFGFVTIAIDLPLHGISASDSFAAFRQAGNERTFDLDLVNNATSAPPGGDGADPSGTHFINLSSLITSRDNLRQAVADLIHLTKSLNDAGLSFDGAAGNDIDEAAVRFAGISLGGIVGTTLLGLDQGASATADGTDELINEASLHVPGGALGKLLDASASFGPRIAAGLAGVAYSTDLAGSASPFEGTDTYETFVRFAQHLTDPGDPINYAVSAAANHRIHMTEVIGDTVVPNNANSTCPVGLVLPATAGATATNNTTVATRQAACTAGGQLVGANQTTGAPTNACPGIATVGLCPATATQDETLLTGYLSGTEPLFEQMGLNVVTINPPASCANTTNNAGLDVVVQFQTGTHGSLLTPAGPGGATQFLAVTSEMQRETGAFFSSNGTTLAFGSCP